MKFTSFKALELIGIPRPSLAPVGAWYWTKLWLHVLDKREGMFTTIRIKLDWNYKIGKIEPIYLDEKKPEYKLFDAEIRSVKLIKKIDITEKFAKGDADMTVLELWKFLDFFYKTKYGGDPQLQKISLRRVK